MPQILQRIPFPIRALGYLIISSLTASFTSAWGVLFWQKGFTLFDNSIDLGSLPWKTNRMALFGFCSSIPALTLYCSTTLSMIYAGNRKKFQYIIVAGSLGCVTGLVLALLAGATLIGLYIMHFIVLVYSVTALIAGALFIWLITVLEKKSDEKD